jgi:ABC-type antimicrobial peptide transport system permease subunit
MLKNYFKTALRNLAKSKLHSIINITGLSVGMAVAMLIGLWIYDEISFDRQGEHYDRIAQVIQNVTNNGAVETWKTVPYPLAEVLRKDYGNNFKRVVSSVETDQVITLGHKKISEHGVYFEPGAPEMFGVRMTRGNLNGLDNLQGTIFLSESMAKAFFGDADPMNQTLLIDTTVVKVTGVYEDFPRNSSFAEIKYMAPWALFFNVNGLQTMGEPWRPNFATTYVELADNADFARVSAVIRDSKLKHVNPQLATKKPAVFLFPMSRWHLYSEFKDGVNVGGAIEYVWMFGTIGVFVLLLACINFMNLSTAQSEKRAREVGIRKTLGSVRRQLVMQFFSESVLTAVFSFAICLVMVRLALPFFNEVADKQMEMQWGEPMFWILSAAFVLFTSLIAGSYPAIYLSSFKPVKVLKGTFKAGRLAIVPRKALVVLQFTISVTLIIGTSIVYQQIQFAKDRPVGYTRAGLISLPSMNGAIHNHWSAVKNELMSTGAIADITESGSPMTEVGNSTSGFSWPGKDPNFSTDFKFDGITYDYGKTIGWEIKKGRNFSPEFLSDSSNFIVNEAAVKVMGLKDPVGANVTWWNKPGRIVGVVKDMVMNSPYEEANPTLFTLMAPGDAGDVVIARINPVISARAALDKITPVFRQFDPDQPFEYHFVDEDYARKFSGEERVGQLASVFSGLAVFISCLGLFGLISFVAEQRKKEIGIRKVLGASVLNVWGLLSGDFVLLVSISFIISIPVAYLAMKGWLQNYHYRTSMSWWIFAAAGAGALLITVVVVSVQAVRAALMNPIKSLRTE